MVGVAETVGVSALGSGYRVYLQGGDVRGMLDILRASSVLAVQWDRVGSSTALEASLTRGGRWARPDLWLVDCDRSTSTERLRAVRAAEGSVAIVAVTSDAWLTEALALEAGADSFCRWPHEANVLPHRVSALLRRASGVFRVSSGLGLKLVDASRQLYLGDHQVQLSAPEYLLLRRLDQQRNQWVSNDELWPLLTHTVRSYDSSLLRMHLLRVRRKLGRYACLLRTERGRGTMLTDDTRQVGSSADGEDVWPEPSPSVSLAGMQR